ncbi:hypothetical protein EG68_06639 [Paragonimus skrjabini miyazakii]|uniref:Major facilitator superfamily (MFS) profile domain-containing protein n=1 Tax=Paragonimus skrjabini miyazakii TaxID=59628 RepID=A0A8S9YNR9_9TREM|nr:hypothetical protein EG68_06639 [Paragonimus skrjabini miyazakii]
MASRGLTLMLFAIALASSFQFGYHTGVINEPLNLISDFISNVSYSRYGSHDDSFVTTITSLCVTAFMIGGMAGALASGVLANKLGRRMSIICLSIPCLTGCAMLMVSQLANSYELVILGRLFVGLACGSYTAIAPVYMSEISPTSMRGAAGVLNQTSTYNGHERIMAYTFRQNDREASRRALLRLREPHENVEAELQTLMEESESSVTKASLRDLCSLPHMRLALFVSVVAQMGQQFSGMNGLLYYSVKLFKSSGLTDDEATYTTIGVGGVLLVVTIASVFLIDRWGRRLLLIGGIVDVICCLIVFTVCMVIKQVANVNWPVYVAILSSYVFVCGFAIGPGSIPWFIVAEFFSQETRDAAVSVAVTINWVCNICLGLVFIQLIKYVNIYSFLPFVCVELFVVTVLYLYMPETMGRSVASVEADFKRRLQVGCCRRSSDRQYENLTPEADEDNANISVSSIDRTVHPTA